MYASSPEDLETLLEDAVLLGDEAAVLSLFADGAVLVTDQGVISPERAAAELIRLGYVASARTVTSRGDVAVVVGEHALNVCSRSPDGAWRVAAAIVLTADEAASPLSARRRP